MTKRLIKDMVEGNELDLSLNGLTEVPVQELANAPKATHLDLSCNKLTILPNNFASLTHLVKIDLSKNTLTELPQNFGNLVYLNYLDLYGNHLTVLPVSFCRLKNLKWLDLKNNPLAPKLQAVAGDCLDQKQCIACAKNVVSFYQTIDSEMEKQKQKKLKQQREKEAAKLAKEQEELAEQRRLKKAERERRKAEAKARFLENSLKEKENESDLSSNAKVTEEKDQAADSKPASRCTLYFIMAMIPIVAFCCMVSVRLLNVHTIQSISISNVTKAFEETCLDLQETIQIWWHAFVKPYYLSLKASVEDWFKTVTLKEN